MVALGSNASSQIFKNLDESEVERLSTEIARLDNVSPDIREAVLEEFHNIAMAHQYVTQGGLDYAREILEAALGPRKAKEILEKVQQTIRTTGFNLLENIDPKQIVNFIQKEHPQTIALLLAHMEPKNAAPIISALPRSFRWMLRPVSPRWKVSHLKPLTRSKKSLSAQIKSLFGGDVSRNWWNQSGCGDAQQCRSGSREEYTGKSERENPELATEIKI